MFRFVILGAASISPKFLNAVRFYDDADVVAIASKSAEKAKKFAQEHKIEAWYDDYAVMLDTEKPDCAYIAATPNFHFELTMLCLKRGIPVICEKAMFMNEHEAKEAFAFAKEKKLFLMEAMWSRFLPSTRTVKQWVEEERIGHIEFVRCQIGFHAPDGDENRFRSKFLGGGAARDILVYVYEQTEFVLGEKAIAEQHNLTYGPTGIDLTDHVTAIFEKNGRKTIADLIATFEVEMHDEMVLYGEKGHIVLAPPHHAVEAFLFDTQGNILEHFEDKETENGFVYEVKEVMDCIRNGETESKVVPPEATIRCAGLFDRIEA